MVSEKEVIVNSSVYGIRFKEHDQCFFDSSSLQVLGRLFSRWLQPQSASSATA